MRLLSFVAAAVLLAPFAFATDGVREAGAALRHAENDLLPSAHGGVSIRTGPDFERFSVGVEGVGELVRLRILLGNGHEEFAEIGTLEPGSSNRQFLRTTMGDGELPFGVERAADLSGRGVRVVDGENRVILFGEVPHFSVVTEPPHEEPPAEPVITRANLLRPDEEGPDPFREARGVVVAKHGADGDALRVEVGRLAPESGYIVFVGEGEDAVILGDMRTNGEGAAAMQRNAGAGLAFTDRLGSLSDLEGRRVEVRDLHYHVVLYGHVPSAERHEDTEPVHHEEDHHDAESGAEVHLEADLHPERGEERLRMEMRDLPRGDGEPAKASRRARSAQVMMDDGTGSLAEVARVRVNRRGSARLVYSTRRGDALPLGAATLRELSGRGFEVRVNGVRAVGGSLPQF